MKRLLITLMMLLWPFAALRAQVGINYDGSPPDSSAMLEVKATNRGLLPPRLTLAQRNALASPAEGLIIYNTDCNDLQYYDGANWVPLGNNAPPSPLLDIYGPSWICPGTQGVPYFVNSGNALIWQVPPGAVIATGQGTNAITVNFGATGGSLSASSFNDCVMGLHLTKSVGISPPVSSVTILPDGNPACPAATVTFRASVNPAASGQWQCGEGNTSVGWPFYTFYMGSRTQMLYKASEIVAAGGLAGDISALGFYIQTANTQVMQNFTIKMGHSTLTSLTGWISTGLNTVYGGDFGIPYVTGWYDIPLSTPFVWDGTSNIVVEICYGDNGSYTSNTLVAAESKPGSTWHYHADYYAGCTGSATGTVQELRPNIRFTGSPAFDCQWKINGANVGSNSPIFTATPANNDVVTCVVTHPCYPLQPVTSNAFTVQYSLTVAHTAGTVAPVSKTVTYGKVTNIPGEPTKCWITRNLGASQQATAVGDNTEASAGWYWQFNRKQGYQYTTSRTPNTTWITSISENSDWQTANDPCNLELGSAWRLPTYTEWTNVDYSGGWTNWNGPWGSGLKLHAAGFLGSSNGSIANRGSYGYHWSSSQYNATIGWYLHFNSSASSILNSSAIKADGFSVRCLSGSCNPPLVPGTGVHSVYGDYGHYIKWVWLPVSGAAGYKWSATDNFITATDMGTNTFKYENDLQCGTTYTRFVWAYNDCGNSVPVTLTASTLACPYPCGPDITKTHTAGTVAPITKTVTYSTMTNILGEPTKCWITRNLGASQQATVVSDNTEASAGWYWQFNRKQGYQHDGTNRTPNTTWISISENTDWQTANDPCNLLLGAPWRLPTYTEWYNVDNTGGWTNWNGPWNSGLKLHAAGYLDFSNGSLYGRGSYGRYWSSTQNDSSLGWVLNFTSGNSNMYNSNKANGFSVRCLRD